MYVLCKRAAIMTTSGVYNEEELDDAEQKYVKIRHDFGNYFSQIVKKEKSEGGIKDRAATPKKDSRYKTAQIQNSSSTNVDKVLSSICNIFTGTGRGSAEMK